MTDAKCVHSIFRIFESRSIGLSGGFANSCYQAKDFGGGSVGFCGGVESGVKDSCCGGEEADGQLWPLLIGLSSC
jgi:hypothetical protein